MEATGAAQARSLSVLVSSPLPHAAGYLRYWLGLFRRRNGATGRRRRIQLMLQGMTSKYFDNRAARSPDARGAVIVRAPHIRARGYLWISVQPHGPSPLVFSAPRLLGVLLTVSPARSCRLCVV